MDKKNSGIEGAPLDIGELESLPFPLDTELDTFKFDLAMLDGPEPTPAELEATKSIERASFRLLKDLISSHKATRKYQDKSSVTRKISIRVPTQILDRIKAKAALAGVGYQTLINWKLYEVATGPV